MESCNPIKTLVPKRFHLDKNGNGELVDPTYFDQVCRRISFSDFQECCYSIYQLCQKNQELLLGFYSESLEFCSSINKGYLQIRNGYQRNKKFFFLLFSTFCSYLFSAELLFWFEKLNFLIFYIWQQTQFNPSVLLSILLENRLQQ